MATKVKTDVDDSADDAAETTSESAPDRFDILLEKLLGGENTKGGLDTATLLQMRMDEQRRRDEKDQRREDKENRRFMFGLIITAITPMLPVLAEKMFGKKDDESLTLLKSLLDKVMNKDSTTDSMKSMMEFVTNATTANMTSMVTQLQKVGEVKERIYEDAIEKLRNKDDDTGKKGGGLVDNPLVAGIQAATEFAKATGLKLGKNTTPGESLVDTEPPRMPDQPAITTGNPPAVPPVNTLTPEERSAKAVAMLVRTLHDLHTKWETLPSIRRAKIRTGLVSVILDHEGLTKAILEGSQEDIVAIAQPVVIGDAKLMEWIGKEGTIAWVQDYVDKQLSPILDEAINGEKYAAERDEAGDDNGDGSDAGGDGNPGIPPQQ